MWKLLYLFLFAGLFSLAGCAASSGDFTEGESGSAANSNGEQGGEGNPTQPVLYSKWEITGETALLNSDGALSAWGWSRYPYMEYNKEKLIDAQKKRLKEWDFYSVYNKDYCFEITMADISWMVLITASLSDYRTKENFSNMRIIFDTSVLELERNPYDDITYDNGGVYSACTNFNGIRTLDFEFSKVALLFPEIGGKINIQDDPEDDSLATAAPFNEPGSFFYTDKVFAKKASGSVFVKGKEYVFDERDSYAVLDWGRGVWPKEFEWGWAVASGEVDGKVLGFNFGFGEENSSRFACNAIVYDGVLHKMGRIIWDYNKDDIMQPWFFRSDDGRFDIKMDCDFDHSNNIDLGFYYMKTIQPRGRFHGKVVLDDGRALDVHGILGFAEHCFQKW